MGSLMESWNEYMRMYGPKPGGKPSGTPDGTPSGTPDGMPSGTPDGTPSGTPDVKPSGTPDGNVRLPGRSLPGYEFSKLLEDYFQEHGKNPPGPDEFERWLDSIR